MPFTSIFISATSTTKVAKEFRNWLSGKTRIDNYSLIRHAVNGDKICDGAKTEHGGGF
jgi:hypothetical protein